MVQSPVELSAPDANGIRHGEVRVEVRNNGTDSEIRFVLPLDLGGGITQPPSRISTCDGTDPKCGVVAPPPNNPINLLLRVERPADLDGTPLGRHSVRAQSIVIDAEEETVTEIDDDRPGDNERSFRVVLAD